MVLYKEIINYIGIYADELQHPVRLLITGRSTLGKSTLAQQFICQKIMKNVNRCFACCPTFWMQDALKPMRDIPNAWSKENVFTDVNDDVFGLICEILEATPQIPTLLFVDDAGSEKSTNRGTKGYFARLCIAAPHLNLTIVGVFQYMKMVTNQMRYNCEALVSFIPCSIFDVKYIYEEFNPCATDPNSLAIVQNALTQAYQEKRFAFILRQKWTGKVFYHAGFDKRINLLNS